MPSELADVLNASLGRQLTWIAAADSKVPPVFAIATAMAGVLAALVPEVAKWTVPAAIFSAIAGLGLLSAIGALAVASLPQLDGPKGSDIFFGGIAAQAESAFIDRALKGATQEYLQDLARQVYRNAEIATGKYKAVKWAFSLLFIAAPFWVVAVYLLYAN